MTISMMLRLKISRTKKRLSEDRWTSTLLVIALMSLALIMTFAFRSTTLSWVFGGVPGEIPLVSVPLKDPASHGFEEKPSTTLKESTPVVILTPEAFYFGDLKAFTKHFADVRNKFTVRHIDGEPQLGALMQTMSRWLAQTETEDEGIVVFSPSGEIPMPIVIQVMAGLRGSQLFNRVILAGGII